MKCMRAFAPQKNVTQRYVKNTLNWSFVKKREKKICILVLKKFVTQTVEMVPMSELTMAEVECADQCANVVQILNFKKYKRF